MPTSLSQLAKSTVPEETVILFGAGSSVPSLAPSAAALAATLASKFDLPDDNFSLDEIASIVESTHSRSALVACLRRELSALKPTGGILNLPLYPWKSLFTTNYDDLIEQSYALSNVGLRVLSSNFDFKLGADLSTVQLFKLHGTIDKDTSDGHKSRIIVSSDDYDSTDDYRTQLYDRLKGDLAGGHLIIIGQSLQDNHIKSIVERSAKLAKESGSTWKISLLMYTKDPHRALLYEKRGLTVSFGGIDEFFNELVEKIPTKCDTANKEDHFANQPLLRTTTTDLNHALAAEPNLSKMFSGSPASYADINSDLTFKRNITEQIVRAIESEELKGSVVLGASGVGKTTACRQAINSLSSLGYTCWEHKDDFTLPVKEWAKVASSLSAQGKKAVLFVDNAHSHIHELNQLLSSLPNDEYSLSVVCASTKNHWNPRVKTPVFNRLTENAFLQRLEANEIELLLNLIDRNSEINTIVEATFAGFSTYERRRRLIDRCESETFVCLKNIFATDKFDDIILREYAGLQPGDQEVYKNVAALEYMGVRVHRQLIIRLLGIHSNSVQSILTHLEEIVTEYTIDAKLGIYGWRGRHDVIVGIISKYKFPDEDERVRLMSSVIENISATYDIELRTVRDLCNFETGIGSISDKKQQNELLRKMISVVPGERVPRHRLIRNLVDMNEFDKAETEIRIFDKDFNRDGPTTRYSLRLMVARATRSEGLMTEDRVGILKEASVKATNALNKYSLNKGIYSEYCEIGIELAKLTGNQETLNDAIKHLKSSPLFDSDPDISNMLNHYEERSQKMTITNQITSAEEIE